ncbi:hypothetical protein [Mannheimia pernigra]|uniref:hypothetical protein n=1 Tax=Mannheimia pernigra TaxID=111844 RepID=UPI001EE17F52|nr:hypothetical protein [Mannheimia pernigra]
MNHRIRLIGKNLPTSQFGEPYLWFESLTGHEAIKTVLSCMQVRMILSFKLKMVS